MVKRKLTLEELRNEILYLIKHIKTLLTNYLLEDNEIRYLNNMLKKLIKDNKHVCVMIKTVAEVECGYSFSTISNLLCVPKPIVYKAERMAIRKLKRIDYSRDLRNYLYEI